MSPLLKIDDSRPSGYLGRPNIYLGTPAFFIQVESNVPQTLIPPSAYSTFQIDGYIPWGNMILFRDNVIARCMVLLLNRTYLQFI